jgi:beta-glucosidase
LNWDFHSGNPDVNPNSDACLVFINAIATEGWDRDGLHDDFSDGLVLNVASKCANTIIVIHTVGVRLVDQWIEHPNVTAVIFAHLPGQDSGQGLVQILYGDATPSGKLPYTMAKNESDYNVYAPCQRKGDDLFPQCDYTEGVYVDYRYFDAQNVTPRYEFGFGLSYTTFEYSSLFIESSHSLEVGSEADIWSIVATVETNITNFGDREGAEVAQLYLGIPNSPPKQLRGFEKVLLTAGGSGTVRFELTRRDLSVWDVEAQAWVIQEGEHMVYVGASSRDIRLVGCITP